MNYCQCGKVIESKPYSAFLLVSFFRKVYDKHTFYLLCDACGDRILKSYNDINGIGV